MVLSSMMTMTASGMKKATMEPVSMITVLLMVHKFSSGITVPRSRKILSSRTGQDMAKESDHTMKIFMPTSARTDRFRIRNGRLMPIYRSILIKHMCIMLAVQRVTSEKAYSTHVENPNGQYPPVKYSKH